MYRMWGTRITPIINCLVNFQMQLRHGPVRRVRTLYLADIIRIQALGKTRLALSKQFIIGAQGCGSAFPTIKTYLQMSLLYVLCSEDRCHPTNLYINYTRIWCRNQEKINSRCQQTSRTDSCNLIAGLWGGLLWLNRLDKDFVIFKAFPDCLSIYYTEVKVWDQD